MAALFFVDLSSDDKLTLAQVTAGCHQAKAWANIGPDLCYMALLGPDK